MSAVIKGQTGEGKRELARHLGKTQQNTFPTFILFKLFEDRVFSSNMIFLGLRETFIFSNAVYQNHIFGQAFGETQPNTILPFLYFSFFFIERRSSTFEILAIQKNEN